jgi:cytochrome c oxidase assembly protein subunit 15
MPFDNHLLQPDVATARERVNRRWVAGWLFAVCAMLLVMIVLGGATRLTGSGLSIMEWAPLSGALPPWSNAEWERLFALYRTIPQYSLEHEGFGLAGFKQIFWLEWTHRLWGRLIGVVFIVPLIVFGLRGMIRRGLWLRLLGLFVLGGLQGAVGWFMVASGFAADSSAVSAYRLVIHLALALTLYAAILWTAMGVLRPAAARVAGRKPFRVLLGASLVLIPLTIVAGGLVAGLHAGLIYNSFPLMGGGIVPPDYAAMHPFLRNLGENVAAVQFDHRLLATATALVVLGAVLAGLRASLPRAVRLGAAAMGLAVLVQYSLGVATLLNVVPVGLATAHQAVAVLLLTAALVTLHLDRRTA